MDSEQEQEQGIVDPPIWRREIKPLSQKETLRRRYKQLFGWKPCGMSIRELEQDISTAEFRRFEASTFDKHPKNPTIGDVVQNKNKSED